MHKTGRVAGSLLTLALILASFSYLPVTTTMAQSSASFQERRRALHERWKRASSVAEKRAILDEYKALQLEEARASGGSVDPLKKLPTAAEIANLTQPLGLSPSLGLGARLVMDGKLSDRDIQMLLGLAMMDGLTDEEKKQLAELREIYKDSISPEALARLDAALSPGDGSNVALNTENKTWTSTYFPMAGNGLDDEGSPENNLWAKKGALAKVDSVIEKRTGRKGTNLERERRPALNGLIGEPKGFFIPSGTVREDDAEMTTGVDFNGDGKITAGVKHDFLDSRGNFGSDGKTDGTMGVGWWGRCNNVGVAGTIFKEPKRSVTLEGKDGPVTLSPTEIKGLLALYSDSIVSRGTEFSGNRFDSRPDILVTKDGKQLRGDVENAGELDFNGTNARRNPSEVVPFFGSAHEANDFMLLDTKTLKDRGKTIRFRDMTTGEVKEYKPEDVKFVAKEDKGQDIEARTFHNKVAEWLADGRGGVLEMDPGSHVWNYNFESANVRETKTPPYWAPNRSELRGWNGPPGSGEISYVETDVKYNGGTGSSNYRYWMEKDANGNVVNSGWASKNADFMWRSRESEIDWSRPVPSLPDLDPKLLKEVYEKSTADEVAPPTGSGGTGSGTSGSGTSGSGTAGSGSSRPGGSGASSGSGNSTTPPRRSIWDRIRRGLGSLFRRR